MRHVARRTALGSLALLLVAGCTPELPPLVVSEVAEVRPVLSLEQSADVYSEVGEALAAAQESLDPAALDPRVTGPARELRAAELTVASARGSAETITEIPTTIQSYIVPSTPGWPRTALAVSERPQNLQTERLLVAEQASPREDYKLWGWLRLFPGVTLPEFAAADIGTPDVPLDEVDTLLMAPTDAVARYVDVLNAGDASAHAAAFAVDPLREQITTLRAGRQESAAVIAGTYTMTFAVAEGEARALRTADGGALVIAKVTSLETLAGEVGATVPPSATEAAFTGGATPANSLTTGRTGLVGIRIPPVDSSDPLTVVGSELLTTAASVP